MNRLHQAQWNKEQRHINKRIKRVMKALDAFKHVLANDLAPWETTVDDGLDYIDTRQIGYTTVIYDQELSRGDYDANI